MMIATGFKLVRTGVILAGGLRIFSLICVEIIPAVRPPTVYPIVEV